MDIEQFEISFKTSGRGTEDITQQIINMVNHSKIQTGLCHIFLKHTSASLIVCENADVQVRKDLEHFLLRLIPDGDVLFKHTMEGKDDMPAHIRTILTQTEINLPISNGKLALGQWQGIFLYEHRYYAQERQLVVTVWGNQ